MGFNMDLILWRHAEAEDIAVSEANLQDADWDALDMRRQLTGKGKAQAQAMAQWLLTRIPADTEILCSPARRTEQTAAALERPYQIEPGLRPGSHAGDILSTLNWSHSRPRQTLLLVGHQPWLGQIVAHLLGMSATQCAFKKAAVWWLRSRLRGDQEQTILLTSMTPEML